MRYSVPYVYLVALCCSLGGFTFGYDVGIISGILPLPSFQRLVGITPQNTQDLSGSIAASLQVGGFVGVILQAFFNDWVGRKTSIQIFSLVFVIGAVIQTAATNIWWLYVGRFVSGSGLFVIMVSISMFNAEMAPTSIRGRIIGIQQFMVTFGTAAAYWTNYSIANLDFEAETLRFRIPFALQIVPCVFMLVGLFFVPKSPRWLAGKGRHEEARKALALIREVPQDHSSVDEEIQEILADSRLNEDKSSWSQIFAIENRRRVLVGILLVTFQQFCGQNMLNYFAPMVFRQIGLTSGTTDLLATGLLGIVRMIMTVPALYVVDGVGRRPLMIWGTIVMILSFVYTGTYLQLLPSTSTELGIWGYFAVAGIYTFMAGYSISWVLLLITKGVLHYVIPAEIYPQAIRAKSETIGAISEGLFQILSIKIAPIIIATLTGGGTFYLYASLLSCYLAWIYVSLPETRGVKLEDMGLLFGSKKRIHQISA